MDVIGPAAFGAIQLLKTHLNARLVAGELKFELKILGEECDSQVLEHLKDAYMRSGWKDVDLTSAGEEDECWVLRAEFDSGAMDFMADLASQGQQGETQ